MDGGLPPLMTRIATETTIAAPPEVVFGLLTDFGSVSKILPGMKESVVLTPGPIAPGSRIRETRTVKGRDRTAEYVVSRVEPGRRFWMEVEQKGKRVGEGGFDLAHVEGGTRVRYTLEFALPWYVFFLAPIVRRIVQAEAVGDLAAIKAHLER